MNIFVLTVSPYYQPQLHSPEKLEAQQFPGPVVTKCLEKKKKKRNNPENVQNLHQLFTIGSYLRVKLYIE